MKRIPEECRTLDDGNQPPPLDIQLELWEGVLRDRRAEFTPEDIQRIEGWIANLRAQIEQENPTS
jgi:hypothetical protein